MPIPEGIDERVHGSKIADLAQHDWVRWGGGLFAAAFLREFTAELPWAHLDIAGPSYNSGGAYGHVTSGGTGFAVATLSTTPGALRLTPADRSVTPAPAGRSDPSPLFYQSKPIRLTDRSVNPSPPPPPY